MPTPCARCGAPATLAFSLTRHAEPSGVPACDDCAEQISYVVGLLASPDPSDFTYARACLTDWQTAPAK